MKHTTQKLIPLELLKEEFFEMIGTFEYGKKELKAGFYGNVFLYEFIFSIN